MIIKEAPTVLAAKFECEKHILSWDLDDLLIESVEGFLAWSNATFGGNLKPEDYTEDYAAMWGVSEQEEAERMRYFHKERVFLSYKPNLQALPILERLRKFGNHVICTSRPVAIRDASIDYVREHFGNIFTGFYSAGIYDAVGSGKTNRDLALRRTKADVVREFNGSVHVDDQLKHVIAFVESSIASVLYSRPWNKGAEADEANELYIADSWTEIEETITRLPRFAE